MGSNESSDGVKGEARGILRVPSYHFQEGQPPLVLEWKPNPPVKIEGVNSEGDEREIQLRAVVDLEIPRDRVHLLEGEPPRDKAEAQWAARYTVEIRDDLNAPLVHAFTLLRWRAAAGGPEDYQSIWHEWRKLGGDWKDMPGGVWQFLVQGHADIGRIAEVAPAVQSMLDRGVHEPVAHQLLREAAALIKDGRRSRASLVLAAAAVEVAVKDLIAHLAPRTEWLMQNLQSPPAAKLMDEYIPSLLGGAGQEVGPAFSADLVEGVKNMMGERNRTVHTGADPLPLERLSRRIHVAEDIVWRCDELAGHEWAHERIGLHRIAGLNVSDKSGRMHGKVSLRDAIETDYPPVGPKPPDRREANAAEAE